METVKLKIEVARQALNTLTELTDKDKNSKVYRDAAIQRFEYTFEATWKAAKSYLKKIEGIDKGSPKGVIRYCLQADILNEEQTSLALQMVDDRNLTSHTYHEGLAKSIYGQLKSYAELMDSWLCEMEKFFTD